MAERIFPLNDSTTLRLVVANFTESPDLVRKLVDSPTWGTRLLDARERYRQANRVVVREGGDKSPYWGIIRPLEPQVVVIGQTILAEHTVEQATFRPRDDPGRPFVLRCSIFYPGEASIHTGRFPAEVGYDFDLPKSLACVDAVLFEPAFLQAVAAHDLKELGSAIAHQNHSVSVFKRRPILSFVG